jgi:hypothetical protein
VYRPGQVNAPAAQLKPANNFNLETRPAPPAYRPQQASASPAALKLPGRSHPVQPQLRNAPSPPLLISPHQKISLKNVGTAPTGNSTTGPQNTSGPGIDSGPRKLPTALANTFRGAIQRMEMIESSQTGTPLARLTSTVRSLKGPQVTESGLFAPYSAKQKADKLFAEFLGMGIGYDLGNAFSSTVLGEGAKPLRPGEEMRKAFSGNCLAMAKALAKVFIMAGVPAEPREVRAEAAGRAFVVHAPNFVDKQVTGHIYKNNVLWAQRYLFTNHTATWVPSLNTYYDLMSGATYQNLDTFIEMELTQVDAKGDIFEGQYEGRPWRVQRRTDIKGPEGGFFRFDMAPAPLPAPVVVPPGFIATPLGVFREGT